MKKQQEKEVIVLSIRKPIDVLGTVIDFFNNRGDISFEGDLSKINWSEINVAKLESENKKVSISINNQTLNLIKQLILPRIGLRKNIAHVTMEYCGQRLFSSYDWFWDGMVVIEADDRDELLKLLQQKKLVKEWKIEKE